MSNVLIFMSRMKAIEPRATCSASCHVLGALTVMNWRPRKSYTLDEETKSFDENKTGTIYVITVINTIERKTTVITSQTGVYDGYTPPLTNSHGTMMEVYTYTFRGQVKETTIAYPTPFFEWPDSYGVQRFSDDTGECVGANSTVDITVEPQPHGPFSVDTKDPLGWGKAFGLDMMGGKIFQTNIGLLPDPTLVPHAEIKTCRPSPNTAADFLAYFRGSWKVVAVPSTVLEGRDSGEITGVVTGGPKDTQKPPSQTQRAPDASATVTSAISSAGMMARPDIAIQGLGFALITFVLGGY
ncbi:hypothetical protein QBC34DRAFT_380782 [Podospora aff. communis PSN243]|uniref:Uncharacterized protein n=1 Tax=Podospora aff. communis PSN243 TaxID=3040156 RepID=A0AAV9GNM4_9PEZI|nr:hypothetical protein QBC34DRAFT_380782 [Podospora aff. communis PSN243]